MRMYGLAIRINKDQRGRLEWIRRRALHILSSSIDYELNWT